MRNSVRREPARTVRKWLSLSVGTAFLLAAAASTATAQDATPAEESAAGQTEDAPEANPFAPAATVDGQIIFQYDVNQRALLLATDADGGEEELKEQALERLVVEALIRNAVSEIGFRVDESDVSRRLEEFTRQRGVSAEQWLSELEEAGVDSLTVGRLIENQLLQETYLLYRYRDQALESILDEDVEKRLDTYEWAQGAEFRLHRLTLGGEGSSQAQAASSIRARINGLLERDRNFEDIVRQLLDQFPEVRHDDLQWVSEQQLGDEQLINQLLVQPGNSLSAPINAGADGVFLLYKADQRIAAPAGVEPFEFDIAVLAASAEPGASDEEVAALSPRIEDIAEPAKYCDVEVEPPEGVRREYRQGVSLDEMIVANREALFGLDTGDRSSLVLSDRREEGGDALAFAFVVCNRVGGFADNDAKDGARVFLREQLANVELSRLSSAHIRELRDQATVEIR